MALLLRLRFLAFLLVVLITGCSGGSNPVEPVPEPPSSNPQELPDDYRITESQNYHYPLLYNLIYLDATDPDNVELEVVPLRETAMHLNILKFLEVGPCTDCFKVVGISYPEPGTINVDIEITHPFDDPTLTAFDVRGIIMFNGDRYYPVIKKVISDTALGNGELLNPEGFTGLYYGSTLGFAPGDLVGYFQGKLATPVVPTSEINGYIRHISDDPANTRNALYAGDSVTRTYSLKYPTGPVALGYAVDASWFMPVEVPVDDPMTDFGPEANCPEPWKIEVFQEPVGDGMTFIGGEARLLIDVYDWQGMGTHELPVVECPELFAGIKTAEFLTPGDGYNRFEVIVANENLAEAGSYICLISLEDHENDSDLKPWLDLHAYQVVELMVNPAVGIPMYPEIVTPRWLNNRPEAVHMDGNYAYCAGSDGISIVDLNDPTRPIAVGWLDLGFYEGEYNGGMAVSDGYLYISEMGMTIADVDPLESAHVVSVISDFGKFYTMSGNIALTEKGGQAHLFDVSTPEYPAWITSFTLTHTIQNGKAVISDNLVYVLGSLMFSGEAYFAVYDIDPPETAHLVGSIENFSLHNPELSIEGDYAFVTGKFQGIAIININNPENPYFTYINLAKNYLDIAVKHGYGYAAMNDGGLEVLDIDPAPKSHVIGNVEMPRSIYSVDITGDLLALGRGSDGMRVMDISQPEAPVVTGNYWVCYYSDVCRYYNGYVYLSTTHRENRHYLRIIDVEPYETAQVVAVLGEEVSSGNCFKDMAFTGNYMFVSVGSSEVWIVDISAPETPQIVKTLSGFSDPRSIYIAGDYAYIGDGPFGSQGEKYIHIYDISMPEQPVKVTSVLMQGGIWELEVNGDYLYAFDGSNINDPGLHILDIDPPESAHIIKSIPKLYDVKYFEISGEYLYYQKYLTTGLEVLDIVPPDETSHVYSYPGDLQVSKNMAISGNYLYLAGYKLVILDITSPLSPVPISELNFTYSFNLAVADNFAYLASYGIKIVKLW